MFDVLRLRRTPEPPPASLVARHDNRRRTDIPWDSTDIWRDEEGPNHDRTEWWRARLRDGTASAHCDRIVRERPGRIPAELIDVLYARLVIYEAEAA